MSRKLGYADDGTGRLAPRGAARDTQRFRLTRERWESTRPDLTVKIEGLDACRDRFGA